MSFRTSVNAMPVVTFLRAIASVNVMTYLSTCYKLCKTYITKEQFVKEHRLFEREHSST